MPNRKLPTKMYRVVAWGHPTLPDLDFETDNLEEDRIYKEYPMQSVALQVAIPASALREAMKNEE